MSFRSRCLLVLILFQASGVIAAENINLTYRVEWGEVSIGEAKSNWFFNQNSFSMTGSANSSGALSYLVDYQSTIELNGFIKERQFQPDRFKVVSSYKNQTKETTVAWSRHSGKVTSLRKPELDLEKVFPIEQREVQGSIDPWSAILSVLQAQQIGKKCNGVYSTYDGRRTAILSFKFLGADHLLPDRIWSYQGDVMKCGIINNATGGHRIKSIWRTKDPKFSDVTSFISEIRPSLFVPVRIEVETSLGKVIARLDLFQSEFL